MTIRSSLSVWILIVLLSASACSTVTIREKGVSKLSSEPTYSEWNHLFLWGLVNSGDIDVRKACGSNRVPTQLQAQTSFANGLVTLLTLGLYSPRNAYVWCRKVAETAAAPAPAEATPRTKKSRPNARPTPAPSLNEAEEEG